MELPITIINSITAFNGSDNCDHTNSDSFYRSYVARKEQLLRNKLPVYKKNPMKVNLQKLKQIIFYLKYAKEHELEVREYITKFLKELNEAKSYVDNYIQDIGGTPKPDLVLSVPSRNEKTIKDEDK